MGYHAGKPRESVVYCLNKQIVNFILGEVKLVGNCSLLVNTFSLADHDIQMMKKGTNLL